MDENIINSPYRLTMLSTNDLEFSFSPTTFVGFLING